jgi:hypothetical protein
MQMGGGAEEERQRGETLKGRWRERDKGEDTGGRDRRINKIEEREKERTRGERRNRGETEGSCIG